MLNADGFVTEHNSFAVEYMNGESSTLCIYSEEANVIVMQ